MALTITDFTITTTVGDNKQPHSGSVTFSDGKNWDWMLKAEYDNDLQKYVPTDKIHFFVYRKRLVHHERLLISSSKREKLVQEYLKRDDLPSVKTFKVSFG